MFKKTRQLFCLSMHKEKSHKHQSNRRFNLFTGLINFLYYLRNLRLANALSEHSSFYGVRRFTGILRSVVYHVYRVIVGEFRNSISHKIFLLVYFKCIVIIHFVPLVSAFSYLPKVVIFGFPVP